MKIIKESMVKGKRRVVVELNDNETLTAFEQGYHYKLGYPMDDQIIASHIISEATATFWDSYEQKWLNV